jgi:hypothetical protein
VILHKKDDDLKDFQGQVQWYISVIPPLRRMRQDHKFKASLGCTVRSGFKRKKTKNEISKTNGTLSLCIAPQRILASMTIFWGTPLWISSRSRGLY